MLTGKKKIVLHNRKIGTWRAPGLINYFPVRLVFCEYGPKMLILWGILGPYSFRPNFFQRAMHAHPGLKCWAKGVIYKRV